MSRTMSLLLIAIFAYSPAYVFSTVSDGVYYNVGIEIQSDVPSDDCRDFLSSLQVKNRGIVIKEFPYMLLISLKQIQPVVKW